MYSRRTGVLQTSSEGLRKIENFNQNLREQYNNTRSKLVSTTESTSKPTVNRSNDMLTNIGNLLKNEEVILIALILLLFFDINRDYLLIGTLAMLLLLS